MFLKGTGIGLPPVHPGWPMGTAQARLALHLAGCQCWSAEVYLAGNRLLQALLPTLKLKVDCTMSADAWRAVYAVYAHKVNWGGPVKSQVLDCPVVWICTAICKWLEPPRESCASASAVSDLLHRPLCMHAMLYNMHQLY